MKGLADLIVHKKLIVDEIVVMPKRVKARYTIERKDGSTISQPLFYSYTQPFFEKGNEADLNLASMMVAQVAMNYGLFFEELVFAGHYDEHDQRFIIDMTENTSREIYVNKFLFKNEFLKPPFVGMAAEKRKKYTAANIRFITPTGYKRKRTNPALKFKKDHFAVLSSGGKDSLLSYGILNEIGTAHPVFVNESGRHWFTAINSYRRFKNMDAQTAKPWCNSDRIFNWMVRNMPFIKENFQNIRADIYPIRLWTVSVFLFGVLPVVIKRGIGNIVIGNEYDCTMQGNYKGITHYNALYDQSKFFDNALTRYYGKKGWEIRQFSILRSLSELLILKTLVQRYPELQKDQVSCHAAHSEKGRMLPCGKCEKCRRIVGMLSALDGDPRRCGYTDEQIKSCLSALSSRSVKQIGSDAAHLYALLLDKKILPVNEHTRRLARSHPQIMKLRFDKERSLLEDLPDYLIDPLFHILEQYAEGYTSFEQGKWRDTDLKRLKSQIK